MKNYLYLFYLILIPILLFLLKRIIFDLENKKITFIIYKSFFHEKKIFESCYLEETFKLKI